jgi:hypothetical protein
MTPALQFSGRIQQALAAQHALGPFSLIQGFLSHQWSEAIRHESPRREFSNDLARLSHYIWSMLHRKWSEKCTVVHAGVRESKFARLNLLRQIKLLYSRRLEIHPLDCQLIFATPYETLEQHSCKYLDKWFSEVQVNFKPGLRRYGLQQQLRTLNLRTLMQPVGDEAA